MSNALTIDVISSAEARVAGRIDVDNAKSALSRGATVLVGKHMVADISGLQTADSVTLAVLLAWIARARKSGAELRFSGVSAPLRAIAHLSDVESLLGFDAVTKPACGN